MSSARESKDMKISPGAVVCIESKLKGNITVGSMTVIHPKATIIAEAGPIIIGENNIVEEQASIIYRSEKEPKSESEIPLCIGVNNVFEVGCEVHAKSIGDHNVFEPKCYVGPDVEIGNGCIIGAGCQITVAEKLPDQTVITGQQCVRSVALDRPPDPDDLTRQLDELTVMSVIFTNEEFTHHSNEGHICAVFEAQVSLASDFILSLSEDAAQTNFPVQYLPPIRIVASLPQDYPSQSPPEFTLSCCWLSKSKLDKLASELLRFWDENKCEILFIWCSFLKDQSIEFLNISSGYDLIEKLLVKGKNKTYENKCLKMDYTCCKEIPCSTSNDDQSNNNRPFHYKMGKQLCPKKPIEDENDFLKKKSDQVSVRDECKQDEAFFKESLKQLYFYLTEYNASRKMEEFQKSLQDCNICFCGVLGEQCKQLNCGHVTCLECLKRMCEVHITEGTMESIVCAEEKCGFEIPVNLIRELVSQDLYDRFDRLMLNRTLDSISNMVYCPRSSCQYPVSHQGDGSLAICPNCSLAFCLFCKRSYHGIEGCRMKNDEKLKLIDAYQDGNREQRLELEKRYGKKQLTELVSSAQSEKWMLENSKKCPCCHINIEKNDGCNKMICRKCNANFCWMCLTRLSSLNPYLHFQNPKSKCFNLLFEGTYEENDIDVEFYDDVE